MRADPNDLVILSRLLDEALDLSPAACEAWLTALPAEHRHLVPRLRDMLAARGGEGFLDDGPRLNGRTLDDTIAAAGDVVGPYRLIREIGQGGMGTVWLAERADRTLKRCVALKLPRLAWDSGLAQRMARERDIGALLEHPHIARLYDAGVDERGRPYLALEYIDGKAIDAWCDARGLDVRARLMLFLQVVRAVAYAHGRLVVHRDLKPSNVLVTDDGEAHLLDFGIGKSLDDSSNDVRLTQQQERLLTPHYAPPEQILGRPITVAADVYSLGVLLYELLTSQLPHGGRGKSVREIEQSILEGAAPAASSRVSDRTVALRLRGEVDAILGKALRRDPRERYATAHALADDLQRHLDGERVLARADSVGYRVGKVLHKHRAACSAALVVLAAVLGGAAISIVQAHRANEAAERARVVKEFVVDVFKVNERGSVGGAELRQLPAQLLLSRGASLIEDRFRGQLELQAELYGVVASIFADMGAYGEAEQYARRHAESLAAMGANEVDRARAALLFGTTLLAQGRVNDAEAPLRNAVAWSAARKDLHADALVRLAQTLQRGSKHDEFLHAIAELENELAGAASPSTASVRLKELQALRLAEINRFDDSIPLFRAAIDEAETLQPQAPTLAAELLLTLAHQFASYSRLAEAREAGSDAIARLRRTGGDEDARAAFEEAQIDAYLFMNRAIDFTTARDAIEHDRAVARRNALSTPFARASMDFDLGKVYLDWGDVMRAAPLIAQGAASLRAMDSEAGRFTLAAYQLDAAIMGGHFDDAVRYAAERIAIRKRVGGSEDSWAVYDYAFAAKNLAMSLRFDEAERVIASAPRPRPLVGGSDVADAGYRAVLGQLLARIALERGRTGTAIAMLGSERHDANENIGLFDSELLRGEVRCAAGMHREGLEMLSSAIERWTKEVYEHHPELARARAAAGLCALADGQRARASVLGGQARASFAAQPDVNPYFKRPLVKLERLLAAASPRGADSSGGPRAE